MKDQIKKNFAWAQKEGVDVCLLAYDDRMSLLKVGSCLVVYHVGSRPELDYLTSLLTWNPERFFFKERYPQYAHCQYRARPQESYGFWVKEYDLKFWVDPGQYHDIGLFADQRKARQLIKALSDGKRVLNLFCYTGGFSVAAALGGARLVKSVDLSETYLLWARKNWEANRPAAAKDFWLKRDVLEWLRSLPSDRFDLIIVDPPTYSSGKKMRQNWDIQKDHAWLLRSCQRLLAPNGSIYFSTHASAFHWDSSVPEISRWKDITEQIQTEDFPRNLVKAYIYQ